jgi:hypothetical protein
MLRQPLAADFGMAMINDLIGQPNPNMQKLPISKSWGKLWVMCLFPSVLIVCTFLCSCSSRDPRVNQTVHAEPQYRAFTLAQIPHHTDEERVLAAYKHYYERFRNIENFNANLPIREEARLAEDYENARDTFNHWLQFVTDSIQEQSELKSEDPLPEFRYRDQADLALSAMRSLDADLLQFVDIQRPNVVEDSVSFAAEPPYDLGLKLYSRFNGLDSDNARIAGTDLFVQYSWAKP